ncbi:hypothetical protein CEXT_772531 [Caerostris extrusa]|uniref:Uncharacterized protein n=1 Tax=Caerostris extrusa TaxID=172846 RepID=A0AAV4MD00_CAEEX|nr:hypothetical protein CEXT_772531 [Caerostris extrusa]
MMKPSWKGAVSLESTSSPNPIRVIGKVLILTAQYIPLHWLQSLASNELNIELGMGLFPSLKQICLFFLLLGGKTCLQCYATGCNCVMWLRK